MNYQAIQKLIEETAPKFYPVFPPHNPPPEQLSAAREVLREFGRKYAALIEMQPDVTVKVNTAGLDDILADLHRARSPLLALADEVDAEVDVLDTAKLSTLNPHFKEQLNAQEAVFARLGVCLRRAAAPKPSAGQRLAAKQREQAQRIPRAWTTEVPKKTGVYWHYGSWRERPVCVNVTVFEGTNTSPLVFENGKNACPPAILGGWWVAVDALPAELQACGPLPPWPEQETLLASGSVGLSHSGEAPLPERPSGDLVELAAAQREYITFLTKIINDMTPFAICNGYASSSGDLAADLRFLARIRAAEAAVDKRGGAA